MTRATVAKVFSGQSILTKASIIEIETDLGRGLFSFSIVGLPDKSVEEAKDRVSSAIKNSGFESPKSKNQKIVISLAPANLKKEGASFDLPIAISYLIANNILNFDSSEKIFLGELALDGKVRKVSGVLPILMHAKNMGFKEAFIPKENIEEALLVEGIKIFGINNLEELINHLTNQKNLEEEKDVAEQEKEYLVEADFADIQGQENAKRALEIAAAGGHNILMYGPPGTGKTMLAKAFASILPDLSYEEMLEVTSIYSSAGILKGKSINKPPIRSPHHTSSHVAIVGGGKDIRAGEITLAHRGVLFLDEFPEFDRRVVESLREPLEERKIRVSRASGVAEFPASFILIAAMNPCPCGNFQTERKCVCPAIAVERYQRKISGPIIDRIDLWVTVSDIDVKNLTNKIKSESSEDIKNRVLKAREIQRKRFADNNFLGKTNSEIKSKHLPEATDPEETALSILSEASKKLQLSPRSFHRILRIGRTIADLDNSEKVRTPHILEALQYREKNFRF